MTSTWDAVEYSRMRELRGPLLVVEGVSGVGWDESARVRLPSGEVRSGLVLEVHRDLAVVQVLQGTEGLDLEGTAVTFLGEPLTIRIKSVFGDPRHGWAIPNAARDWRLDPATCGGGPIVDPPVVSN